MARLLGWFVAGLIPGLACIVATVLGLAPLRAQEASVGSAWVVAETSKARLVAGGVAGRDGQRRLSAGLEITLADGWKTYWRNPGTSGVPPQLDWSGSDNLASATLRFPAPSRFRDRDGDTIGYKSGVVLPVDIVAQDPAKPITLKLEAEYGVCRDVCIPVQQSFQLVVPSNAAARAAGSALTQSIDRIPRGASERRATDPVATAIKVELTGAKPRIVIDAEFPSGVEGADAFLEAPEGLWVPLAKAQGPAAGTRRQFEVDLTDGADLVDLKGRTIRLTLVATGGQSETEFKLE